jgi:hypothetical protein
MSNVRRESAEPGGLAITFTFVAGLLMIATGLILVVYGVGALFTDFGRSTDVFFRIGPKAWGVIHTIGGVVLFMAGCNLFVGRYWARVVGIAVACIVILGALASIEAYTFWALGLILLSSVIIWALAFHSTEEVFSS